MRQKVYNYYLIRFRIELLSQKKLEKNLTAAEILSKDAIAIVRAHPNIKGYKHVERYGQGLWAPKVHVCHICP